MRVLVLIALAGLLSCGGQEARSRVVARREAGVPAVDVVEPVVRRRSSAQQPARGRFTRLAARGDTTCRVQASGRVSCWGARLGLLPADDQPSPTPVALPRPALSVAVGGLHACAIVEPGDVYCWGEPPWSPDRQGAPAQVLLPDPAVEIVCGGAHACALLGSGAVWCWGDDEEGQVSTTPLTPYAGRGGPPCTPFHAPAAVPLQDASQIAAADTITCALIGDEMADCWGRTRLGRPGLFRGPVVRIPRVPEIRALFAGPNTVATITHAGVFLAHANVVSGGIFATPQLVGVLKRSRFLAIGEDHALARMADGSIMCFGRSPAGQCGELSGDRIARRLWARGSEIAVGASHSCLVDERGAVLCWGSDEHGQRGDGPGIAPGLGGAIVQGL